MWQLLVAAAFLILVTLYFIARRVRNFKRYPPLSVIKCLPWRPTIFVSIASYRDPEVLNTVKWLIERACHPEQLRIYVLEQNDPGDASLENLQYKQAMLNVSKMKARKARGPLYARSLLREKYNGEDFYLQIDSHIWPRQNWDSGLIQEILQCSPNSILSTYPSDYDRQNPDASKDERATILKPSGWYSNGALRLEAITTKIEDGPQLNPFCVAGFYFGQPPPRWNGDLLKLTKDIFYGEEIINCARLWTSGCNFYAPSRQIMFHHWDRSYRSTFWKNQTEKRKVNSSKNWNTLQNVLESSKDPLHLLGSHRTLAEYQRFCKVDFKKKIF